MEKKWFIYSTEEHNPNRKMLFEKVEIKATVSLTWVSVDYCKHAVAFSSKEQALIYLYQYIKPFVKTNSFERINVTEICTEYIDTPNECLFMFKDTKLY